MPSSKRKYDRMWNSKFGKGEKAFTGKNQKKAIFDIFLGNVEREYSKEKIKDLPVKGENIETGINVSLYDAFYGLEKQIAIKEVDGNLKTYSVKIPKGIRNGEKIRLIGQGKKGKNGGKNGDLLIEIKIEDDNKFKLKGFDIYTDLLLTPWEAALGTRTMIKTIDDEINVYVPEGIQTGETLKIPNKGYYENKEKRGDLVAEVKVVVPKHLSEDEKKLYQKLSKISKFNPRT